MEETKKSFCFKREIKQVVNSGAHKSEEHSDRREYPRRPATCRQNEHQKHSVICGIETRSHIGYFCPDAYFFVAIPIFLCKRGKMLTEKTRGQISLSGVREKQDDAFATVF